MLQTKWGLCSDLAKALESSLAPSRLGKQVYADYCFVYEAMKHLEPWSRPANFKAFFDAICLDGNLDQDDDLDQPSLRSNRFELDDLQTGIIPLRFV